MRTTRFMRTTRRRYTHVAAEGGFDLDRYRAVRAWCERVRAQPRHIPITAGVTPSGS